ncbi:MAG: hypothetical protein IKF75_01960, partial [Lachnospiraceae bacterium]|nr:hypothetical protein [Lachnospiraceae bacterium]
MKKKYCAPVIKAALFKAEEAVSACVVDNNNVKVTDATPEDDYWWPRGDNWAYGSKVRGNPDYWYTRD